jgi:hypothetical protein
MKSIKLMGVLSLILIILTSCIQPTFDGSSEEKWEESYIAVLNNTPVEEREELKGAIAMLLIFGTGDMFDFDNKELRRENLRKQLDGMTREEVLIYIRNKAKNDYK